MSVSPDGHYESRRAIAHFILMSKSNPPFAAFRESPEEIDLAWRPLNPNHAIERAKVSLFFSQNVPDLVRNKARASFDARRAELGFGEGALIQGAMISFQIGQPSPTGVQPGPVAGWQFARSAGGPGLALEVLELSGAQLSYESSEYSRWNFFAERLQKVWGDLPGYLGEIVSRTATVVEYVDRFIYDGDPQDADVRSVLGDVVNQIPDQAASGSRLWHVHRGWFEDLHGDDILVNINLGTQDGVLGPGRPRQRTLEGLTRVELRHGAGKSEMSKLYQDLYELHQVANRTFAKALSHEGREMIGIAEQE